MYPWTLNLHKKYGEVVRILPDELSFTASAWDDIYTSRPQLPKSTIGSVVAANGTRPIVTIVHNPDHTRQRRILSHAFSDRALKEQEYILQNYSNLLVGRLREVTTNGHEVDICKWYDFVTFDIIGDLCFGESFKSLESAENHPWVAAAFTGVKISQLTACFTYFPPLNILVSYLTPAFLKEKVHRHFVYSRDQIEKRIARKSDRPDFMRFILENNHEDGMTRDEIHATVQLLVLAGSETSATTMTSTTWYTLKHPHVWKRLRTEIRCAFAKYDDIDVAAVSSLPFLHAVVQEAMRLHPPGPVAVPREVDRPNVVVSGRPVPPKVCTKIETSGIFSLDHLHRLA